MSTLTPVPSPTRQETSPEPRTKRYPAGRAIAVVLLALLLAAVLDADSLVASVSSERFGKARSIELALVRPFRSVSDTLGLNLPHRWLAEIGGTNQPNPGSSGVPSIIPGPLPLTPPTAIVALLDPPRRFTRPPPPSHAPPRPQIPTAANPMRVWLAGDSMMGALADGFMSHVTGNPAVAASADVMIGTGLARPDVYNWPATVASEVQHQQPNVVVLTFGANDDQDMMAGSQYLVRATPAWQAEYARRVGLIMSEVAAPGRLLVWLEVPPVARPRLQQTDQIIDGILRQQAARHPGVVLVNPGPVLAPGGTFTTYLPGSSGQPIEIRTADGIHLTPAGAARVLPLLLGALRTRWALS